MTEEEWLSTTTAAKTMLTTASNRVSSRKLTLIGAGICGPEARRAAESEAVLRLVEQYADGLIDEPDYARARDEFTRRYYASVGSPTRAGGDSRSMAIVTLLHPNIQLAVPIFYEWALRAASIEHREFRAGFRRRRAAARTAFSRRVCDLIREIVGNPFRPWQVVPDFLGGGRLQPDGVTVHVTSTALALAAGIHAEQAFDRLPILADALEEAGVTDPDLLAHCRTGTGHVRGCWALDVVRGKA